MNPNHTPTPANTFPPETGAPDGDGEESLGEMLATLWDGRYLILGATIVALLLGSYYVWRVSPVYRIDAMLQIEDKKAGKGGAASAALEGIFEQTTKAQAEIEILNSNMVLGRAVEALSLDIMAIPDFSRLIGDARVRGRSDAPEMLVERFEIPSFLRGASFYVVALEDGRYRLEGAKEEAIATAKVGEELKFTWQGQPILLEVRRLASQPGQRFLLVRQHPQQAIGTLRRSLKVSEKGKQTNILGITFEHRNPGRGAEILNEIIGQYVRQNIERKAEEASQTLAFLQEQMPQLRSKLDAAEDRLNEFRRRSGSVDMPEEVKLLLKQSVDMESQILQLKQKKDELLRTYQESADVVTTMNQQLAKLEKESTQIEAKVRVLPQTQQEVLRLYREVQVNTELYTALLNNVQQLQVAKAGEIGNARIVDRAMPTLAPIKPQKAQVMGLATLLGIFAGIGLTLLVRALNKGVEDPRLIESRLGLPVMVTIPHSEMQPALWGRMRQREKGQHLLAIEHPEDLTIESLRSLRTSLHFAMTDARNRVIMIAGPSPGIGKSFVSSNFATLLAQTGSASRVLLVDGDMRRGNLHLYFGVGHRKEGLSEVLAGQATWREMIRTTAVPGLDILTTGTLPPNPAELLMSGRFSTMIDEVSEAYDLIIFDAPPILAVTDPVIIGGQVGTVLLLAKSKAHPLDELRTAIKRFTTAGIQIKGCIFNDVLAVNLGYRYYRYAYHYGYKKLQN